MTDQEPPADALHRIRDEIAALKDREEVLKALLLNDPSARTGNHYVAIVKAVVVRRPDWKQVRLMYPDIVEEHTHAVSDMRVEFAAIDEDGVITPIKRRSREAV